MQRKKLPVGMVIALAVLLLVGVFVNAGNVLKTAGLNLGNRPQPPTEMHGHQLSEDQMKQQREAMIQARASRTGEQQPTVNKNPDKPALLIEPDIGNFKQQFNPSQTAAQWYREDSYIEEKKREAEAARGGN